MSGYADNVAWNVYMPSIYYIRQLVENVGRMVVQVEPDRNQGRSAG